MENLHSNWKLLSVDSGPSSHVLEKTPDNIVDEVELRSIQSIVEKITVKRPEQVVPKDLS